MKSSSIFVLAFAVLLSLGACNNAQKTKKVDSDPMEQSHEGHDHEGHNHAADGVSVDSTATTPDSVSMDSTATTAMLCGGCGQIKGSEKCCVEGTEKCEKCDMDKGSPGCCKITADAELCNHCGEIAGSEDCCKKEA